MKDGTPLLLIIVTAFVAIGFVAPQLHKAPQRPVLIGSQFSNVCDCEREKAELAAENAALRLVTEETKAIIMPVNAWLHTYQEAELQAEGRLILMYYTLPGCKPCKMFERDCLHAQKMQERLLEYVLVNIDELPEKGTPEHQILHKHKKAQSPFVIVRDPISTKQYGFVAEATEDGNTVLPDICERFAATLDKAEKYLTRGGDPVSNPSNSKEKILR